jgi:multidrug resistance efflux pump
MKLVFLLLPICAIIVSGCDSARSKYKVTQVSPWITTAVGRIDSAQEARQLVASVDGIIDRLYVERGQMVRKGEALLRVACGPLLAEIATQRGSANQAQAEAITVRSGARTEATAAAEASVSQAKSNAQEKQQQLDQALLLVNQGFISRREVDARTNARDSAMAEIDLAEARFAELKNGARQSEIAAAQARTATAYGALETAQSRANQCILRSPISGQILQILHREGEFSGASQGTPLIIVGDISQLIVRAEVNERDAALLKPGQAAEIWIDGQAQHWPGTVTHMANVMGRRSARSLDPTDRFDRDVREAFIAFTGNNPPALVGLRVTVGIKK